MFKNILVTILTSLLAGGCSQKFDAMKTPTEQDPWVIRTDFSSDEKWTSVRDLIAAPQKFAGDEFFAYVRYVNEGKYRDKGVHDLVRSLPNSYPANFCFAIDRKCIEDPEHSVLVVGFYPSDHKSFDRLPQDTPSGDITTFRALPSQIQGIENNLSIGNMDYDEFANSVDNDGVFRGFRR